MDRDVTPGSEAFVLPSRRGPLAALSAAVEAEAGPVLITGEPGVGKTWLAGRLAAAWADPGRWLTLDLGPADRPGEILSGVGRRLGLVDLGAGSGRLRLDLAGALAESSEDGHRWALTIDEAHLATADVLEEVRVLSNALGRPDGLAALVIVGQTALARRLATRPGTALGARLAARVHLRPLDLDEARALLEATQPGTLDDPDALERRHRQAGGNPRRLLVLAGPAPSATAGLPALSAGASAIVPARPPIQVEDGVIEVGWDAAESEPRPEPAAHAGAAAEADLNGPPVPSTAHEGPVDDHYAALQAWSEWTRNQGLPADDLDSMARAPETPVPGESPQVWADGQHRFAPYSQLFTRLRQIQDANG